MDIWSRLKTELIDIVQYLDDTNNTMVYRFERFNNEIKYGAKLVVREGQAACFVNEGQLADVFTPGTHTLQTQNLPILATLKGWKYGFESPFKAEVYFVSTRQFTDLKWGTMNPIMLRDPEFGPVRLRAFGSYAIKVVDPGLFLKQIVGTDNRFTTEEITGQLRNLIVSQFGTILGQSKVPMLDLAGKYAELGAFIRQQMSAEFGKVGLDLPTFVIENISLPEEVEKALDKRASMGVIGDLGRYTQMQAADSMPIAAGNPSAGAGAGMGLGMGVAMGQQMAAALAGANQAGANQARPATPPPLPGQAVSALYFAAINGQQVGPFDVASLGAQARAGAVTRETLVWCEGMSGWAPAGGVPGLAGLFPPPLPPQGPAQG
ncbi:MAG: SPFH domain-containing protein [Planctomycetota bacterium]|nr:SPFH domain-containing protein [Planctomycetota bacterium]